MCICLPGAAVAAPFFELLLAVPKEPPVLTIKRK